MAHPSVSSVAVFGVAHELHGQEIMAVVVLSPGADVDTATLAEFAKEKLAAYKYPRRVEIVEVLPLGPSGKVLKRELVALYETVPEVVAEALQRQVPVIHLSTVKGMEPALLWRQDARDPVTLDEAQSRPCNAQELGAVVQHIARAAA